MSKIKVGDFVRGNCEDIWMEAVLDYAQCSRVWDMYNNEVLIESMSGEMYWLPSCMFDKVVPQWGIFIKGSREWWDEQYIKQPKNKWGSNIVTHNDVLFIKEQVSSYNDAMVVTSINRSRPRIFNNLKEARDFVDKNLSTFEHKSLLDFRPYCYRVKGR